MILLDANLLLYAKIADYPQHASATTWLEEQVGRGIRIGLPWASTLAFLRIITNPRIFDRPMAVGEAWRQVREWLALPGAWIPLPTERHSTLLGQLITETGASANLIPDAHLATLALEHGLTLCSGDTDFARFPGLRWVNPLANSERAGS